MTFHQDSLQDAVKGHLDSLAKTVTIALGLAVAFWWAGIQKQEEIEALGMKFLRSDALIVACAFYLVVNFSVVDKLLRIGDVLDAIDDQRLVEALTRLGTHAWFANPFAYFGDSFLARAYSSKGFGSLIVVWWICNSSLYTLADDLFTPPAVLLQGAFLLVGLFSMQAINRIYRKILGRLGSVDQVLQKKLESTSWERQIVAFVCIAAGGVVAFATMALSQK